MKVTYLPTYLVLHTYYVCMYVHNYICCTKPSGILFLPTIIPTYIVVLSFAGGGVVGWMSGLVMGNSCFGVGGRTTTTRRE